MWKGDFMFIGGYKMVKQKCEVYSRVVGYIRPLDSWNDSKQAEFHDRRKFDEQSKIYGGDINGNTNTQVGLKNSSRLN